MFGAIEASGPNEAISQVSRPRSWRLVCASPRVVKS